jgi:excisionase family DNA binding protein
MSMSARREYRVADAVLSTAQAADRMGVSTTFVRSLIKRAELPATLIGGTAGYRIRASAVDEWLLRNQTTSAAARELERARAS